MFEARWQDDLYIEIRLDFPVLTVYVWKINFTYMAGIGKLSANKDDIGVRVLSKKFKQTNVK